MVSFDIIIAGSGISGLASGIQILEGDPELDVLILEKGTRPGGTTRLSGIAFWSVKSLDSVEKEIQSQNPTLLRLAINRYEETIDWLDNHGVPFDDVPDTSYSHPEIQDNLQTVKRDKWVNPVDLVEALVTRFNSLGGELRLETPVKEVQTNEQNSVSGVIAENEIDRQQIINTNSLILATGGFPGNEKLVQQYITTNTSGISLRACRWCTGDGVHLAADIGAKLSPGMGDYYGVQMLAPPAEYTPREFVDVSSIYGPFAVALNRSGERFIDESKSIREHEINRAAIEAGYSRVYYIFDSKLAESSFSASQISPKTLLSKQKGRNGRIAEVDSMSELAEMLSTWGVDGKRAINTLQSYNTGIHKDDQSLFTIPRTNHQLSHDTPPFFAIEVQPSITQTYGGLDVNQNLQVLSQTGSSSRLLQATKCQDKELLSPITGLYAAGADVGHIADIDLINPCTVHTVLARIAGRHAAEYAKRYQEKGRTE